MIHLFFFFLQDTPSEGSNKDNQLILSFLKALPKALSEFYNTNNSNLIELLNKKSQEKSKNGEEKYFELFQGTHEETFGQWETFMRETELLFKLENSIESENTVLQLKNVGLTGSSLRLKFTLLKDLEDKFLSTFKNKRIDFTDPLVQKAGKAFLAQLNTILGSMSVVFPIIEKVKELKECIENAIEFVQP